MDALSIIGEQRIREAVQRGDLDDLPTHGTPIPIEDLSGIAPELRLGYLALRTTGYVPEEVAVRRQMLALHDLIELCDDEGELRAARKKLSAVRLRWEQLVSERGGSAAVAEYRTKIDDALQREVPRRTP